MHAVSASGGKVPESIDSPAMTARDERMNRNCPVNYTLEPLPPEKGGGWSLFVGESRNSPRFPEVTDIRTIDGECFFCSSDMVHVRGLSDLESFSSTAACEITNEDLHCLKSFTSLKILRLASMLHRDFGWGAPNRYWPDRAAPFSAAGLAAVRDMPQLRELMLVGDGLTDEGMDNVAAASDLRSLTLSGFFTNDALRSIGALSRLERLSLTGDFDDAGLLWLSRLNGLETLILNSPKLRGPGLAHLASLPRLRYLRIGHADPDLSLHELARWPSLEFLNLDHVRLIANSDSPSFSDGILASLPPLPQLRSLSLAGNSISDEGLECLMRFPSLTELNLRRNRVTDVGLARLTEHEPFQRNLRVLCLGEENPYHGPPVITQAGLGQLTRLRELEGLDLRTVDLTDVDLQVLAFPSLRRLNMIGLSYQQQDEKVRSLFRRLPLLSKDIIREILIRAELMDDFHFMQYDFLDERMRIAL